MKYNAIIVACRSHLSGFGSGVQPLFAGAFALGLLAQFSAQAQEAGAPSPAASAPARARASDAASAPQRRERQPAAPVVEQVEVIGGKINDTSERRQSTAAKIIVGRDEIDRMGDSTVGEILKRLPGVTMQGAPGRGGNIRMRGLGGGYTQILLDGERVAPGFSMDSLTPEQIDRIEILRAPTAETGARAIAGTINIITREGFRKRVNDLKLAAGYEAGRWQPQASWTRNGSSGAWSYNFSLSGFGNDRLNESRTDTQDLLATSGTPLQTRSELGQSTEQRHGLHLTSRLQWRDAGGDTITVMPFAIYSTGKNQGYTDQTVNRTAGAAAAGLVLPFAHSESQSDSTFSMLRLNTQGAWKLTGGTRLELRANGGQSRSTSNSTRITLTPAAPDAAPLRSQTDDKGSTVENSVNVALKSTSLFAGDHSVVSGLELEAAHRNESRHTVQDGSVLLPGFGDDVSARTSRAAAFVQDEWTINPLWAAHAGLRWEGIQTRGDGEAGSTVSNRSSVWTPLLHAVWKPEAQSRDQVRISLTRSYRSPTTQNLIARPSINTAYPVTGTNTSTGADRAGNPALQPELATGIDLAFEHYFAGNGGGLLSANVFYRQIKDYIRNVTRLETVNWSNQPRWVSRPQNVGAADTAGLELEAKFRLNELWADWPAVDVRSNASIFTSHVNQVPGPDNRLDQQPSYTANLGADYRFRGTPITVGGNLNWNPAYDTRVSDEQTLLQGKKSVLDAYLLWTFDPNFQVRTSLSNVTALDYATGSRTAWLGRDGSALQTLSTNTARSDLNVQVRFEFKL